MIAVAAIVVVIVAALIFFAPKFFTKAGNTVESELKKAGKKEGPQLEVTIEKTVNPDTKTEDFTEYMTADQQVESGKLIDIGLGWKTTTGFEEVNKLVFKRKVNGEEIQEAIEHTGEGVDNYSSGKILFDGENIESSPVGENMIEIYYTLGDSDELVKLTEVAVKVDQKDLAMTTELLAPKTMEFKPTTKKDSFSAELVSEKVFYVLKPNSGKSTVMNGEEAYIFTLDIKKTGDDDVVAFKTTDADGKEIKLTVDGNTDFILKKKKKDIYFLTTADGKAVTAGAPTRNKIPAGGSSGLTTLLFEDMTPLQYKASMFKIIDSKTDVKFPKEISGLSGRYVTSSVQSDKWNDISGKGNDCTEVRGSLKNTFSYVYGGIEDGFKIPKATMGPDNKYTIFYVARYNGWDRRRIFDGVDNNWLSGFHNHSTGVAHRNGGEGWMAHRGNFNSNAQGWIQCTDQRVLFRTNGRDMKNRTDDDTKLSTSQITVNFGQFSTTESSDWAVKEIIIYNRELTLDEVFKVENYLVHTYPEYKFDPSSILLLDPEEKHRTYSSVHKSDTEHLNESKMFSGTGWSAAGAGKNEWLKIDLENKYKIVGVVVRGRQNVEQYPTKVALSVNGIGTQEFTTTDCWPNHTVCMFRTPIIGNSVKVEALEFKNWPSVRAAVIVETGYGKLKFGRNFVAGYPKSGVTYPTPQEDPAHDRKASDPMECQKYAEENKDKYVSWGYRTIHHPQDHYRGTCWFYKTMPSLNPKNPGDVHGTWEHMMGCTDPEMSVASGCTKKHSPSYVVTKPGQDRPFGDIEGYPVTTTLQDCQLQCSDLADCVGISYKEDTKTCFAKKADGLNDYTNSQYQFYERQ